MHFFNFQLQILSSGFSCPFPGLTVITKEMFLTLKVITIMAFLLPIFAAHRLVNRKRHRDLPPCPALYGAVAIEILLLGYERLAETSLRLLRCLPIHNQLRLFYEGNIECWQWWQYLLAAYVIIVVVPSVFVLYWGSLKLHTNTISNKELLFSCVIPLPFLIYWAVKHYKEMNTFTPDENIEEVTEVLHIPFQPPSNDHPGTLYWESVLIGRRLVLLCMYTLITDPMVRMFSIDCACLLILVHHLVKSPYRDVKVNFCESVSLLALVVLSTMSALEATLMSLGVEPIGPNGTHFRMLKWIEIVILGLLPAVLLIMVSFAILSQTIRLVLFAVQKLFALADKVYDKCRELWRQRYLEYRGHHVLEFCSEDEGTLYDEE